VNVASGAEVRTGILLSNLGTPDAPTPAAVRRYLREFLSDRRVVNLPPLLWQPILHGLVLPRRPQRSAHAYQQIWSEEGSPLLAITQHQAEALRAGFADRPDIVIALGMRYGNPSIAQALDELHAARIQRLLVLPLYPQYSSATTASTFDEIARCLRQWIDQPDVHFFSDYHDRPWYIAALIASIREAWREQAPAQRLLFSFHGMPTRTRDAGDPYYERCMMTARLLASALDLPQERWHVTFQSRFGAAEWLQPYTDKTLVEWAAVGVESVDVVCPGFSADCLETLEEIAMTNRDLFLQAGGKHYRYIPALNARADHVAGLREMISQCL
jgi:ferrochelatase